LQQAKADFFKASLNKTKIMDINYDVEIAMLEDVYNYLITSQTSSIKLISVPQNSSYFISTLTEPEIKRYLAKQISAKLLWFVVVCVALFVFLRSCSFNIS
jgi:hypothetical protein